MARFEKTGDWKPADVVALLDDIAAASSVPLDLAFGAIRRGTIETGTPLPKHLATAPWGEARPCGLRMAWLLEPRAAEYRLGTPLKSRILLHNSGKTAVVFHTRIWHQSANHKARDANGAEIAIESIDWTTIGRLTTFRLAPGEFVELLAAGIGVGANRNDDDWQNTRVGAWIDAKAGVDVIFTPDAVPMNDWNEAEGERGPPAWWLDFITARLARELPLPAAKEERTGLLDRVTRDLFGAAPTAAETTAFIDDREPDALATLVKRLAQRPGLTPYSGPLRSAETAFRVLPADPDAAKKPRVADGPGRYNLGDLVRLVASRRLSGERVVNEATMEFYAADATKPAPGKPHAVKLPDDYGTWAAAWMRGGTVLWVRQGGSIRSYDFSNPAEVKEANFEGPAGRERVPEPIRDALRAGHGAKKP